MPLLPADVACWLLKTARPPAAIDPGWRPGTAVRVRRCLRPSYRLGLMAAGQPCLLWLSGPREPGVHAVVAGGDGDKDATGGVLVATLQPRFWRERARAVVAGKVPRESQQQALRMIPDSRLREVVSGFAGALERGDADALVALLTEDVTWSMPPLPNWYHGRDAAMAFAVEVPFTTCGDWAHRFLTANGQPAVASYSRRSPGEPYRPWSINVLELRDGRISGITSFIDTAEFERFGLPARIPALAE